jgi:hypothetical protein
MSTNHSGRILYVWGWWAWYYRFIALIVYGTGLLLVGLFYPARELVRHPSFGNVLLFAILVLIVGAWFLVGRLAWRDGQSRATRITLLPESASLLVRTLNFGSRRIPLADLEDIHYQDLQPDPAEYREPTLVVKVRGGLPLRIDLEGCILDEQTFRAIFGRPKTTQPKQRLKDER